MNIVVREIKNEDKESIDEMFERTNGTIGYSKSKNAAELKIEKDTLLSIFKEI